MKANHSPLLSEHGKHSLNFPAMTGRQMLARAALALGRENEHLQESQGESLVSFPTETF